MSERDNSKKKKRQKSILEKEIFSVINQSLKAALDAALKDILKDFK